MSTTTYPIDTVPLAILPLLIEAKNELHSYGAPQASRIAERISTILTDLIDVAADVEAYGNKWIGGKMEDIATALNIATKEWYD